MEIKCLCCKEIFNRRPSLVRKRNFCSLKCRDEYDIEDRYGHLFQTFNKYADERSYLFGLILGDGHQRKNTKKTIRISIGFDIHHLKLIKTFCKVAKKLKINYFVEPKKWNSCQSIGFTLPDELLRKYNMFYYGAKFKAQPRPTDDIINNINFAVGLINSDGWCGYRKRRGKKIKARIIMFNNTVNSIVKALVQSLEKNDVIFCEHFYKGRRDERTGNTNKDFWVVKSSSQKEINKLMEKSNICLKESK